MRVRIKQETSWLWQNSVCWYGDEFKRKDGDELKRMDGDEWKRNDGEMMVM